MAKKKLVASHGFHGWDKDGGKVWCEAGQDPGELGIVKLEMLVADGTVIEGGPVVEDVMPKPVVEPKK